MSQFIATQPDLGPSTSQAYRDWLGVGASVLCAIHCAAMPFVVGFLPLLGLSFLADPSFHKWMVGICLGLALLAFVPGWRRHHRLAPAIIGVSGLTLITLAAFAGPEDCCPTPCDGSAVAATNDDTTCAAACCDTEAAPTEEVVAVVATNTLESTTTVALVSVEPAAASDDPACAATCCASKDANTPTATLATTEAPAANSDATCAATCCASKETNTPAETPANNEAPAANNTTCAATCCSTNQDMVATTAPTTIEQVAVIESEDCVAICCPEESSTVANAGSGEFMSLVWTLMTPLGGLILVAAHLTNHRLGCQCKAECCPHGSSKQPTP